MRPTRRWDGRQRDADAVSNRSRRGLRWRWGGRHCRGGGWGGRCRRWWRRGSRPLPRQRPWVYRLRRGRGGGRPRYLCGGAGARSARDEGGPLLRAGCSPWAGEDAALARVLLHGVVHQEIDAAAELLREGSEGAPEVVAALDAVLGLRLRAHRHSTVEGRSSGIPESSRLVCRFSRAVPCPRSVLGRRTEGVRCRRLGGER